MENNQVRSTGEEAADVLEQVVAETFASERHGLSGDGIRSDIAPVLERARELSVGRETFRRKSRIRHGQERIDLRRPLASREPS